MLLFDENLAARLVTDLADQQLSVLYGAPPKVIWIRLGNCSTADIIRFSGSVAASSIALWRTKKPLFLRSREYRAAG